jgi:hypothetical protein
MKIFKITCFLLSAAVLLTTMQGCVKSFLDIVPDNVPTIDNAFTNRNEAEKFLYGCYSELPQEGEAEVNPAMLTGDEFWIFWEVTGEDYWSLDPYNIARGNQNKVKPYMNLWDTYDKSMWKGIRNCNIFLENIDKPADLDPYLKERWIAEAKFLKAYFHWYLFRMYGPIPIIDKNLPINASNDEVKAIRQPVDSVVNYIANLLDEAAAGGPNEGLPEAITALSTELGRATKPAALAIKARLLATAASPLFNGNPDLKTFKNSDGRLLFNATYSEQKWVRAKAACKAAIDAATAAGVKLYRFVAPGGVVVDSDKQLEMNIRNAVCEKWNSELIWGNTGKGNPTRILQLNTSPQLQPGYVSLQIKSQWAPTMKIAEQFYTKNGVPITEDKTWDYANKYKLKTSTAADKGLQTGYQTVGLHFDREPRFYADMAFDGSLFFMRDGNHNIQSKSGEPSGKKQSRLYSVTGYYAKKLVNWNLVETQTSVTVESYPWPVVRLADLYLLYAEAAVETNDLGTALTYINLVRERAGLNTVENSWTNFSTNPSKYTTQGGLRDILQQERMIEMTFEGSRFWDLKRWKKAQQALNQPVYGWDVTGATYEDYNRRILLFDQTFISPRDYFWPISENNFFANSKLVQNPGW